MHARFIWAIEWTKTVLRYHCVKSVQIRSFFWSVFSCIRTECGDLLGKSPYSVRIQKNTDQSEYRKLRTRDNSVFGHFSRSVFSLDNVWINEYYLKNTKIHLHWKLLDVNMWLSPTLKQLFKKLYFEFRHVLSFFCTKNKNASFCW